MKKIGFLKANPESADWETFQLEKCQPCGASYPQCQDLGEMQVLPTRTIVALTYQGEEYFPDAPILATDQEAVLDFIRSIIHKYEGNPSTAYTGTLVNNDKILEISVCHEGQGVLSKLSLDDGNSVDLVRCCERKFVYEYEAFGVDELPEISWDGTSEPMPNNPYPFTGDIAADEATATQATTDLEAVLTNLGMPYESVLVTSVPGAMAYKLSIVSTDAIFPMIGENNFALCKSEFIYSC